MGSKVVVGMSGGVDSSVAALLLKKQGYEVIGVTMQIWQDESYTCQAEKGGCCGLSAVEDARRVADALGIPYYVMNFKEDFQRSVIDYFTAEYLAGRTPNPCIACNRYVKWEALLRRSMDIGAEYIATGHYASVERLKNGRLAVKNAAFAQKDQTYMLYRLTQNQLARTLMPLGKLTKDEVRRIAASAALPVANKPDSQEICFVTSGSYADFIEENAENYTPRKGNFVDESGNILGEHKGLIHYTVGQRKGLGIAVGKPIFVKRIDAEKNEVVLADDAALYSSEITCDTLNFQSIPGLAPGERIEANVRIRYHHAGEKAVVEGCGEYVKVTFGKPVRAATPGQSAVFYDAEGCVIGGGRIV